jgi:hypothetical protein
MGTGDGNYFILWYSTAAAGKVLQITCEGVTFMMIDVEQQQITWCIVLMKEACTMLGRWGAQGDSSTVCVWVWESLHIVPCALTLLV